MQRPPQATEAASPHYDGPIGFVHVLGHPGCPLDVPRYPADAQVLNCHNICLLLAKAGVPFAYYGLPGSCLPAGGRAVDIEMPVAAWEHDSARHEEYTRLLDVAVAQEACRLDNPAQLVLSLYGCAHADIGAPNELGFPVIEPMVGYDHCWAPYRVFPSYAHQSVIYSHFGEADRYGIWRDTVIPHFLDPADYWCSDTRGDYVLYLGRNAPDKGVEFARYICEQAGLPLRLVHDGVSGADKTELLSQAIAVLMPTLYLEPFGYVAVEAQMCGVPAVTTDWGAFAETVEQARTGFRCRTPAEFLAALRQVRSLDPQVIRERAVRLYGIEAVTPQYLAYFAFVWETHSKGYDADEALRLPFLTK